MRWHEMALHEAEVRVQGALQVKDPAVLHVTFFFR